MISQIDTFPRELDLAKEWQNFLRSLLVYERELGMRPKDHLSAMKEFIGYLRIVHAIYGVNGSSGQIKHDIASRRGL